jgi:hypothetical protein
MVGAALRQAQPQFLSQDGLVRDPGRKPAPSSCGRVGTARPGSCRPTISRVLDPQDKLVPWSSTLHVFREAMEILIRPR